MGETGLRRAITLPRLLLYGLGTMVGGGFYALTGKIAGEAGLFTPVAFLLAGALALLNGFSFAELSARFPSSAGEARYVQAAFERGWLAALVGWLVIATGVVSASTLAVATIGFLRDLAPVPEALGVVVLVLAIGLLAAWGIAESVTAVAVITVIEVGALLFVLVAAGDQLGTLPARWPDIARSADAQTAIGIVAGAFLGFYAFVGFEDLVNLAEEVKDVRRNLPRAILASVALATVLYVAVSLVAVLAVPPSELAESRTPLATVVGGSSGASGWVLVIVSILTGINGALVQIVMGSRVAYGMARRGQAPRWLGSVHPRTRTPLLATALVTAVILALALLFPLVGLAKWTSSLILVVFALVNLALLRLKRRSPPPEGAPSYPIALPALALAACVGLLAFQIWQVLVAR
jgi:amino acid transporter